MREERFRFTRLADLGAGSFWNDSPSTFLDEDLSLAERTYFAVLREWGLSVEFGDRHSLGHSARVAERASALAARLGANDQMQTTIRVGAYLHDVGRLRVAKEILTKQGPLSTGETEIVRKIPIYGTEVLAKVKLPWDVNPIVRWHNERHDGSGYPDALRGREIPMAAQIVGIANVYDALTSTRPHRPAYSPRRALREMSKRRHWWCEEVFDVFLELAGASYSVSLRLA
jgi:HD-GYP domain-containing protein (c-di-GMP phosphodiesterase class II)